MAVPAPQSQKPVLAGLIAFGVLAIVLGGLNLKRAVGVMRVGPSDAPPFPRTREELEAQQRVAIAGLDTDRDGLFDLDELERVHSSPFLADSDSDGKSDKEEVDAGEDPNCPIGKACAGDPSVAAPSGTSAFPLEAPGLAIPTPGADASVSATTGGAATFTPAELRAALARQGIPKATLDAISDEQLMASYGSTLQAFTKLPGGGTSPIAGPLSDAFASALRGGTTDVASALDALPQTPSAIRETLLRGGFPREQLQKLDDAQLLVAWQQVISDLKKEQSAPASP
ncbi:MAG: thrombospondin type 3 repeat-containing protein [bacterium]|nr:thrombospondin type 3 repeat-containing protein [bacterium]